jgi:ABC-2 type transport system permease protein
VEVEVVSFRDRGSAHLDPLIPVIVFFALRHGRASSCPAPAWWRRRRPARLAALLVTPVRVPEVFLAKWLLGVLLGSVMAVVTLALQRRRGGNWLAVLVVVLVARRWPP